MPPRSLDFLPPRPDNRGTHPTNPGDPTPNGTASIVFPWTHSTATAPTVTVHGTASDPEGVAAVSIGGIAATIVATGSGSALKPSAKGLAADEVEWTAEIPLSTGENALVVSVEDADGNVTEDVDSATIRYVEVPTTFTLDPEGTRLVGFSFTLASTGDVQRLVQHNYKTDEQTVFETETTASPELTCFRRFENEFLYLSFFTGSWELRRFDLTTQEDSLLRAISDAELESGRPGFRSTPHLATLVCDSAHTSAYLLANYTDENGNGYRPISAFAMSRVLEIPLAGGPITALSETDTTVDPEPRWIAQFMALDEAVIVTMEDVSPLSPLISIPLAGGPRTELTPGLAVGGLALDPVLSAGRVYVATFEGVDEIDVATPSKRAISEVDESDPFVFSQVESIGVDAANNRVIVGDSDLDALIAVDLSTGARSDILSRKVGAGTALIAPRRLGLSSDGARAYVADDGGNAPARLFEIDLESGDRRVIGDISQPFNSIVTGLALDEANGRVFVSFPEVLLEVGLETEEVLKVASTDTTDLEAINDFLLDAENGRLLVGDVVNHAIYALDLATHAIEVVSQEGGRGAGPAFGGIISMTRVAGTPDVYVADQPAETIFRVNLETGDREALVTSCIPAWWTETAFQNLNQVLYNGTLGELIISGDNFYSLDPETGECTSLLQNVFPLHIQATPANQMLAVTFGTLVQLDRALGEVVIVSK